MKNILSVLFLILVISCGDAEEFTEYEVDEPTNPEQETLFFKLLQSQINLPYTSKVTALNYSTNTSWELVSKPDWITIEPEHGDTYVEVSVTVSENVHTVDRTGDIIIKSMGKEHKIALRQGVVPVRLLSYSGMEGSIKMDEPLYLLFNRPVDMKVINSGESHLTFNIERHNIEYFDDYHGIKFTGGPMPLGGDVKYRFQVSDADGNILTDTINFGFYSDKIKLQGRFKKMIRDDDDNMWVLTIKDYRGNNMSFNSTLHKFSQTDSGYEHTLNIPLGIDNSKNSYDLGDFFINPYNNLIYVTDYEDEEIEVYDKNGSQVKTIGIDRVPSDHPDYPHLSPHSIGFNNQGKGIVALAGKGVSRIRWRYIDSSQDDVIREPNEDHPYFYNDMSIFVLDKSKSNMFVLDNRTPIIKVFDGGDHFDEIYIKDHFDGPADAVRISVNKFSGNLYLMGLWNQQIMSSDGLYKSHRTFSQWTMGDFSYDSNLNNHIYAFNEHQEFKLYDYENANTLLTYPLTRSFRLGSFVSLKTSTDGKYVVIATDYSNQYEPASEIIFLETSMLH